MTSENDIFDDIEGLVLEEAAKLFSPIVIEHFNNPRNMGSIEDADAYTFMSGICGDTIGIFLRTSDQKISKIGFVTNGCGPTIACASALTSMAEGRPPEEARRITPEELIEFLGGLPKENTHCADLAVNTLRGALAKLEKDEENKLPRACILLNGTLNLSLILNMLGSFQIVPEVFSKADEALRSQQKDSFQLLIVQDDPSTGEGLKLIGEFLKINWMTSAIVVCDQDEAIIHDRAEGLGILGHIRTPDDLENLAKLITKFKQLSP
ncbi:MAG: iron-sulfur cluster assembly scaffold protein [Pseudomonadota bacterium]